MKKFFCAALALMISVCFFSCAAEYKNDVKVSAITEKIKAALPLADGYAEHDGDYLIYRFEDIEEHIDGYSIIYSSDTRYADLVAVFHAKSISDAKEALDICKDFIEDQRTIFGAVVEQYLPSEGEKLDSAEARAFGNYVVVCVLTSKDAETAFSTVEKELS